MEWSWGGRGENKERGQCWGQGTGDFDPTSSYTMATCLSFPTANSLKEQRSLPFKKKKIFL